MGQHRPGDASVFVGQRHSRVVLALAGFELLGPLALVVAALAGTGHFAAGTVDKQRAQVAITPLGDPPQPRFAAGTVLPRH